MSINMIDPTALLRATPLTIAALLIGCSDSGLSVNPSTLVFNAASTTAGVPESQTVVGTVSGMISGKLYIVLNVYVPDDEASSRIDSFSDFRFEGNSGQATVNVKAPDVLGPGTRSARFAILACTDDPDCSTNQLEGSPQTVT